LCLHLDCYPYCLF